MRDGGDVVEEPRALTAWQQRLVPLAGILYVLLGLASTFIAPIGPAAKDPGETIAAYFAGNRGAIITAGYLDGLTIVPILVFAAGLDRLLRAVEGTPDVLPLAGFGGALLIEAFGLANSAIWSTLAVIGRDGDPAIVHALFDLNLVVGTCIFFAVATWLGCTSVAMPRLGGAFRWIAALGLIGAVLALIVAGSYAQSGVFMLGNPLSVVPYLVHLIWILATSIVLLLRVRSVRRTDGTGVTTE